MTACLPDDPTYCFCPEPESDDDAPRRILLLIEDLTVAVPTALVALTRADGVRLADRLNRKLGLDRAAWTALAERCMHPAGGHTLH